MNRYSATRDLTMQKGLAGYGMPKPHINFMCGHQGPRAGALFRRPPGLQAVPWRCAACVAERGGA